MQHDGRRKHPLPAQQRQLIAVAAGVDIRTVDRLLAGQSVKPVNQRKVLAAVERLAAGQLAIGEVRS